MNAPARSRERREILAVARRYRRDGYKVNGPDKWSERPSFLGDLVPDLIAERDDDNVVIEVKGAAAVRGANEIVELAERVALQPGWRFELIAVPKSTHIAKPDLTGGGTEVRRLLDQGFPRPAFVVACAMIESLAAYASAWQNRNPANLTLPALVRDLVVHGIIDEAAMHEIHEAQDRRNTILHDTQDFGPTRGDVEALLELGFRIEREILSLEAG